MLLLAGLLGCAPPSAGAGGEVYARTCASCHGLDGSRGVQVNGVPATELAGAVPELDDAELVAIIDDGIGEMPAQNLDRRDTADCIAWLRETFGP
jgi:mono/diheme cytochrome c family protein